MCMVSLGGRVRGEEAERGQAPGVGGAVVAAEEEQSAELLAQAGEQRRRLPRAAARTQLTARHTHVIVQNHQCVTCP